MSQSQQNSADSEILLKQQTAETPARREFNVKTLELVVRNLEGHRAAMDEPLVQDTTVSSSNGGNSTESGLSPMQVSFLATGVLFGVCVLLGAVYFILYNTHLSPASMRAREKRATMGGEGGGGGGHRKTQTHFTLFHPKGGGRGGSGRGGGAGTKTRL